MNDTDTWTPLDPVEGPTVWARQHKRNQHTIEIVTGTDPEDPMETFLLSHKEIRRISRNLL
jgi:hypothetical protein